MMKYNFLKNCTDISIDSKSVKVGTAFFAIKGGIKYAKEALAKGASIVVTDDASYKTEPFFFTEDILNTLYESAKYLYPKKPKYNVSVTGTNGKTSVVSYFMQLCSLLNLASASIGTMGMQTSKDIKAKTIPNISSLTTPDLVTMYKLMDLLSENGIDHLAFEASSHGLDQNRLYGIKVRAAAITNITHDHLDYHKTFENYKAAKLKLFSENLENDGTAIINSDMDCYNDIKDTIATSAHKIITIGKNGDLSINTINSNISGQEIFFTYHGIEYSFKTDILGSFQASNLLIAALLLKESNKDLIFEDIISVIDMVKSPKGRLERVELENIKSDYHIFVDYAHTPDALEQSILELSKLSQNRIILLFGCGGNRDKTKRPVMGKIASSLCDFVIVTDDNPRNENPSIIRSEILSGISSQNVLEIEGRETAIEYAISQMQKSDILLIAGKGHENYQIIGDQTIYFDDMLIAKRELFAKYHKDKSI